jgi:hypothetical protein
MVVARGKIKMPLLPTCVTVIRRERERVRERERERERGVGGGDAELHFFSAVG